MIARLLFAFVSLGVLAALLYLQQQDSAGGGVSGGEPVRADSGYAAINADLIETGDDGAPLYNLHAERVEQATPQSVIVLTTPKLDYTPPQGNPWTVTADQGELPPQARSADLHGSVHAQGVPEGSEQPLSIDTDVLHLDMEQQLATTNADVRVNWQGNALRGRGLRADLKTDHLQLAAEVHGVIAH